jgi:hypothetical protein
MTPRALTDLFVGAGVLLFVGAGVGHVAAWLRCHRGEERRQRVINRLTRWDSHGFRGLFIPAVALGGLAGIGLKLAFHAMLIFWPLAGAALGVALVTYSRRMKSRVVAKQQLRDAQVDSYIGSSLTDEGLQWAVSAWSKRYRR